MRLSVPVPLIYPDETQAGSLMMAANDDHHRVFDAAIDIAEHSKSRGSCRDCAAKPVRIASCPYRRRLSLIRVDADVRNRRLIHPCSD
jgi:hypothetical protein